MKKKAQHIKRLRAAFAAASMGTVFFVASHITHYEHNSRDSKALIEDYAHKKLDTFLNENAADTADANNNTAFTLSMEEAEQYAIARIEQSEKRSRKAANGFRLLSLFSFSVAGVAGARAALASNRRLNRRTGKFERKQRKQRNNNRNHRRLSRA